MAQRHRILILGGGTAGIATAARLRNRGETDIGLVEPAETHYYQPLFTLVGGGCAPEKETHRPMASVMPKGVAWIKARAESVDPDAKTVSLDNGADVEYETLVVCPGLQLNFDKVPGMAEAMRTPAVSSNYQFSSAPDTWRNIQATRGGTALFTMPAGPVKCAGAPQKIAYLAADYWRQQGTLADTRMVLVLGSPGIFSSPTWAKELTKIAAGYGIEVRTGSEAVEFDPEAQTAVIRNNGDQSTETITYDMAHVVPPQSAPDWLAQTPLADPASPFGYVEVDKHTLRHTRYPDVFALGDASNLPTSKTGAAIRKQYPVVAQNLLAARSGLPLTGTYGGYTSCPLTTSRHEMLLAEFDYDLEPDPSFPIIDTTKPRRDMWYLKRYGLPQLYWNVMMRGRG